MLTLGVNESAEGRSFTSVDLLDHDLGILSEILADLVTLLRQADAGERMIVDHQPIAWKEGGLSRRLIVCNEARLRAHPEACVVGFFGKRKMGIDIGPLEEANSAIVAQFKDYPGIFSYSSIELPNRHWANLVLHDDPVDRKYWRRGELHAKAARELSPLHYKTVRIHNARLSAPVLADPDFRLMSTKYWDYGEDPVWAAERRLVR
ncbi:MAG: hypothetical protein ACE5F5_01235 [Acidimicrobiia bacterium]